LRNSANFAGNAFEEFIHFAANHESVGALGQEDRMVWKAASCVLMRTYAPPGAVLIKEAREEAIGFGVCGPLSIREASRDDGQSLVFPKELHRWGLQVEMQRGEELWSVAFKAQYAGKLFEFFSIVVKEDIARADDEAMGFVDISAHVSFTPVG
jgi:hypothetical protein